MKSGRGKGGNWKSKERRVKYMDKGENKGFRVLVDSIWAYGGREKIIL